MSLGGIEWGGMDWVDLARNRHHWNALLNAVISLQVLQIAGRFLDGRSTSGVAGYRE
jgi:hypothetical protein